MPRAKRAKLTGSITIPENVVEGSTSSTTGDVIKKVKTVPSRRNIRGRRGGLKDMPHMPLDILIEIFRHMHPRDLLTLARTTKDFRSFLMSKGSVSFWRTARQQLDGLPDCPHYLSEPAYANLVFFSHCHECLKPNVKIVIWEFCARYCPACKARLVHGYYHPLPYTMIKEVEDITSVQWGYLNEFRAPTTKGSRYEMHYLNSEATEFRNKWTSLSTNDEKKAFVVERVEAVKERKKFSEQMHMWQKAQLEHRSQELDSIRAARFENIRNRLADEGWAEEIEMMGKRDLTDFSWQKAVRKSQKLTEYGWQSIRAELHEFMEQVRTSRLVREHHDLLCARLVVLCEALREYQAARIPRTADADWCPFLSDYAMLPQIREVIETPPETAVTKETLLNLCETHISTINADWYDNRKQEFVALVRKKTQSVAELTSLTEDPDRLLSLAIATFKCVHCPSFSMRWPQVLSHRCGRASLYNLMYGGHEEEHRYRHAVGRTCIDQRLTHPWKFDSFIFNGHLAETCAVIKACGKDPAQVTYDEMETCGVRLSCHWCSTAASKAVVISVPYVRAYNWRNAVFLHAKCAPPWGFGVEPNHQPEWVQLDAELAQEVLWIEASQRERFETSRLASNSATSFGCTHCRFRALRQTVLDHCVKSHGKTAEAVAFGTDYYIHADNRPYLAEPIRIYTETSQHLPEVVASIKAGDSFITAAPLL